MNGLNYHHLQYFWVLANAKTLSRASQELRLAPSTLSAQIHALEEELGVPLVRRRGRGLELTEHGQIVKRYADQIFSLGMEMKDALAPKSGAGPRQLSVAVIDIVPKLAARLLIDPALELCGPMRLIFRDDKPDALLAALSRGTLDLILSSRPAPRRRGAKLFSHSLGQSAVRFYARTDMAVKHRSRFPRSLDGAPILLPTADTALRRSLDRWFVEQKIRPRIVGEFQDYSFLVLFGQAGTGIFAAPSFASEEVQHRFGVNTIGDTPSLKMPFYAITADRPIKHPAVRVICETAHRMLEPLD